MSVRLKHHLYTSIGGYRTVYADAALQKPQVERLERLARTLYPHVGGRPCFLFFHLDQQNAVYLKVFRSGVDHVGRPKACVHTIVSEIDGGLPPSPEPQWFVDTDLAQSDIPALKSRLVSAVPKFEIVQTAHLTIQADLLSEPPLEALLLAAISNRPFFIIGGFFPLMQNLTKVMALIPKPSRLRLYALSPPTLAEWVLPRNIVMTTFLCVEKEEANLSDRAAVISLSPFFTRNLPETNTYIDFIKKADADAVGKLVALLERFAPYEPLTCDAYSRLISAFTNCQDAFGLDGTIQTDQLPPSLIVSMRDFLAAGLDRLVIHILETLAEKSGSDPELTSLLVRTKALLSDPTTAQYDRENILDKTIRRLMITISRGGGLR